MRAESEKDFRDGMVRSGVRLFVGDPYGLPLRSVLEKAGANTGLCFRGLVHNQPATPRFP
jgi:hypothetical protein